MKKIKLGIIFLLTIFLTCSCSFKKGSLDNATIYTTVYPVNYIISYLYGDGSTIQSIYPNGVDIDNYSLTTKQIENYANGDLFVYVGLGNEKEIAKTFINENSDLLIIDATYGLSYSEDIKELWLAPNNFLMLCKNIKNSLNEYLDNSLKIKNVNDLYDELYAQVSWVDAEMRNIAREAKENNNNTLVVTSKTFKFLENYGFEVVVLEELEENGTENAINDLKNNFKNGKYNSIIKLSSEEESDFVKNLVKEYNPQEINFNDMITNDTTQDYIAIQYENIAVLRELLLD